MPTIARLIALAVLAIPTTLFAEQPDQTKPATTQPAAREPDAPQGTLPSQDELNKKFEQTLTGATLAGHFTDRTQQDGRLPKEEKYTIESVKKLPTGDYWLFTSRIQYGDHDVKLPLALRVVWAGDTPVITLDKVLVPGFGTFTCRVMIYDDKYTGMWEGGDHGGLMFGKITRDAK